MANRFVHFSNKATFTGTQNYESVYAKSIVFLQDTQEIWTHGTYYAIPDSYKTKITNLETAVKALQDLNAASFAFKQVKAGSTTVNAASGKEAITFAGGEGIDVSLSESGTLTITSTVEESVTGVKSGDKVLSLSGTELTANLSLKYDSEAKKIYLYGKDETTANKLSEIDASAFIKDGMVSNAELVKVAEEGVQDVEVPYIKISFNTDAGSDVIRFSVKDLVDVYDGSNLKLKSITIPGTYTEPAANDSVDSAIAALVAGIRETKASAGVTKFGGKAGDITVDDSTTTSGAVKFAMSDNKLTATVVNGVTTEGTLADGTLIVGAGNKGVKTLASGTEGQVLSVGEEGLEWKDITDADTTYTFSNGTDGSFTVTPKNGQPQKVSIGKPATAGVADQVENALTIKLNGGNGVEFDGSEVKELDITAAKIGAATAAQGAKADSAIQSIRSANTGTYISVTGAKEGTEIQLTPSVTVQAVASASTSAKGLVEASDVKKYIDDLWEWEEA